MALKKIKYSVLSKMIVRSLKNCLFHLKQQKRGTRRWIVSVAILQVLTVLVFFHSSTSVSRNSLSRQKLSVYSGGIETSTNPSPSVGFNENLIVSLAEDETLHFQPVGIAPFCYVEGTDVEATLSTNSSKCVCRTNYFGHECGIPASAWHRTISKKYHRWPLKPRKVPRRIIHGLNINHETDFFRVRLEELKDAVDVYIVCESNYTAHGDAKPLYLMEKLRSGFVENFHSKIVHVSLHKFPPEGRKNGWYIDMYLRTYMGTHGLNRIRGVRSDDLFVLLDADEIPTREVLMFLKLYDGYPEPVRLAMRWSVFGFFWKRKKEKQTGFILDWLRDAMKEDSENDNEDLLQVTAVSTMNLVWKVCRNNTFLIRKDMTNYADFQERLSQYRIEGNRITPWTAGTKHHYAGYHCSWCYSPEGIRTKLLSAHADDKPRWGDFAEKLDIAYISRLIREGEWFDATHPFLMADWEKEDQYAPKFMLQHYREFSQLLYPPDMTNVLYSSNSHNRDSQ